MKTRLSSPTFTTSAGLTDLRELDGMYVDPKAQRQGLGNQLLEWGIEKSQSQECFNRGQSSSFGVYLHERYKFESCKQRDFEPYVVFGDERMHLMNWEPLGCSHWSKSES